MRDSLVEPLIEAEARLLILIAAFGQAGIEGRTKLAKLDFLLRYPSFLGRALRIRAPERSYDVEEHIFTGPIESRMIRYRYGPWDPSYFTLLGRLVGRGLINVDPGNRALTYYVTITGRATAKKLAQNESWRGVADRSNLLKRHFNLTGTSLKRFVYEHFPEVTAASWGDKL